MPASGLLSWIFSLLGFTLILGLLAAISNLAIAAVVLVSTWALPRFGIVLYGLSS